MADAPRILLDSHALLWALDGGDRLGPRLRAALEGGDAEVYLSAATVWELGIKVALGRLGLPVPLRELVRRAVVDGGLRVLDVTPEHALTAADLPLHHRDPFHRLLVAQALVEGLALGTRDPLVGEYGAATLW